MKICELQLNYAGYCLAKASHAVKGDPPNDIQFKAMFGLIKHPTMGWILFDTGYTRRFYEATSSFPNRLYAWITKVFIDVEEEVQAQLKHAGIEATDIHHVLISHFHADHIGGLKDFKNAQFYCSKKAWLQVSKCSDFWAFSKGILKSLIPNDFMERVTFIEDINSTIVDPIFGKYIDLFGDDSMLVFNVPGHAAGQIGVKLKTNKATYLLVADACWDSRAYTQGALPSPLVKLFFDSWEDYVQSVLKLKNYHHAHPAHVIIPSHCFESYRNLIASPLKSHVL